MDERISRQVDEMLNEMFTKGTAWKPGDEETNKRLRAWGDEVMVCRLKARMDAEWGKVGERPKLRLVPKCGERTDEQATNARDALLHKVATELAKSAPPLLPFGIVNADGRIRYTRVSPLGSARD